MKLSEYAKEVNEYFLAKKDDENFKSSMIFGCHAILLLDCINLKIFENFSDN